MKKTPTIANYVLLVILWITLCTESATNSKNNFFKNCNFCRDKKHNAIVKKDNQTENLLNLDINLEKETNLLQKEEQNLKKDKQTENLLYSKIEVEKENNLLQKQEEHLKKDDETENLFNLEIELEKENNLLQKQEENLKYDTQTENLFNSKIELENENNLLQKEEQNLKYDTQTENLFNSKIELEKEKLFLQKQEQNVKKDKQTENLLNSKIELENENNLLQKQEENLKKDDQTENLLNLEIELEKEKLFSQKQEQNLNIFTKLNKIIISKIFYDYLLISDVLIFQDTCRPIFSQLFFQFGAYYKSGIKRKFYDKMQWYMDEQVLYLDIMKIQNKFRKTGTQPFIPNEKKEQILNLHHPIILEDLQGEWNTHPDKEERIEIDGNCIMNIENFFYFEERNDRFVGEYGLELMKSSNEIEWLKKDGTRIVERELWTKTQHVPLHDPITLGDLQGTWSGPYTKYEIIVNGSCVKYSYTTRHYSSKRNRWYYTYYPLKFLKENSDKFFNGPDRLMKSSNDLIWNGPNNWKIFRSIWRRPELRFQSTEGMYKWTIGMLISNNTLWTTNFQACVYTSDSELIAGGICLDGFKFLMIDIQKILSTKYGFLILHKNGKIHTLGGPNFNSDIHKYKIKEIYSTGYHFGALSAEGYFFTNKGNVHSPLTDEEKIISVNPRHTYFEVNLSNGEQRHF